MPRISGTQPLQIRANKNEVKGRDFFTLKGKSQRLYLEKIDVLEAKNVTNLPSSFYKNAVKGSNRNAIPTAFFSTALGLGLLANLPSRHAAAPLSANNALSKPPDRMLKNRDRLTSMHLPQSLPDCMQKPSSQPSRFTQKSTLSAKVFPQFIPSLSSSKTQRGYHHVPKTLPAKPLNADTVVASATESVPPNYGEVINRRDVQRGRAKRQQQERDAKASRNQGDEHYWSPLDALTTPVPPLALEQTRNVTAPDAEHRWEKPLKKVICYLQSRRNLQNTPPAGYPSLVANRLDTAKLVHLKDGYQKVEPVRSDEALLEWANDLLNPTAANYSLSAARRFVRDEALLYYVKSKTIDWDLNAANENFDAVFIAAHHQHNALFTPEWVVKFYAAQFKKPQRQLIEPFKTREQAGGLTPYYAQFNDYLAHHAADDAATLVAQTVILQQISPLDLERCYVALFSLRVGELETVLLPQSAHKAEQTRYGPFIYILKGDSGRIYAASLWGPALVVADVSELFTPEVIETISALKQGKHIASATLSSSAIVAKLWPNFTDNAVPKKPIMARFTHQVEFDITTPTLTDCLVRIQHQAINMYIDAWRDSNLNKTTLENILSMVPFFDVIQRKFHDPAYHPTLKELAFDLIDLGITLFTLGIPLMKLGLSGVKAGLLALKAGRAAGLMGAILRNFVLKALQPAVKNMAKITAREIACFIVPPLDLARLLRKPVRAVGRKIHKAASNQLIRKPLIRKQLTRRCRRAIGGACLPFTQSVNGLDINEWEKLLTKLVTTPVIWHGTIFNRQYRHSYIKAFRQLSIEQQRAIRDWSFMPKQKRYNNYPRKNSSPEGMGNVNFQLNEELVKTFPDATMLRRAGDLRTALRLLPDLPARQRLIRIVDIPFDNIQRFRAGDIVSNYPTFMSASAEGRLLNIALHRGALFNPQWINNPDSVIAVYIISGKHAKPLMLRVASQVKLESEYLFEQKSFFRIEAITSLWQTYPGRSPKEIYFIKMEEIPYHRILNVKNIFTGDKVSF